MIRRPSRIVIAQAVVVGLLVVVVSATLLQPEEDTPLSGVETPGELVPGPPITTDGHGDAGGDRETDHDRGNRGDRPPGGGAGPGAGGSTTPEAVAPESAFPAPPAAGDGSGEGSPADDQYADTLARLSSRLN